MLLKGQQMPPITGDQVVGGSLHRTRQDSVVGMVGLDHGRMPARLDYGGGLLQGFKSHRRAILGPVELAFKYFGHLSQYEQGKVQLEP